MGRTFHFECPHCHYHTRASGGLDEGVHCRVQTIVCLDCRELFDVYTRIHRHEPPASPANHFKETPAVPPNVLVENPIREFDGSPQRHDDSPTMVWEDVKLICPKGNNHRVEPWRDPGRCPRCGVYLEKNGFPWRLWE